MNLDIIKNLNKPFYIILDSDKNGSNDISNTRLTLIALQYKEGEDFHVTRKREMENYIIPSYFSRQTPPINIEYNDWEDVKQICKSHIESGRLGGKNVLGKHFNNLTYSELKATFDPTNQDDEFLKIYNNIKNKIES